MQCGASLRPPQSMVTQTDSPASINPSHVVATSVGSSNKIFFILLAVIVLVGIIIVATIMLSGPSTPNILSIDQAVEEGYPVTVSQEGKWMGCLGIMTSTSSALGSRQRSQTRESSSTSMTE